MEKSKSGFTLVELLVVLVIIVILATISYFAFNGYQAQARDGQRASSAQIIAEGLERYYDTNNEYPSASKIIGNASMAQSTLSLRSASVLKAPQAPASTTNSIIDEDIADDDDKTDVYAYVPNCTTNNACESFQLKYRKELSREVVVIESRHKPIASNQGGGDSTSTGPSAPVMQTTPTTGAVAGSVTEDVDCTAGTAQYKLRSRVDKGDWSDWSAYVGLAQATKSVTTTPGSLYGFQAVARCVDGSTISGDSDPSAEAEYYEPVGTAPDPPQAKAEKVGANVVGSVLTATTCDVGTPVYKVRSHVNDGDWSDWTNYASQASATKSIPTSPSTQYGFQVAARCVSGNVAGPDSDPSDEATYYEPGDASTPTMTAALSGSNARGTSSVVSCGPDTTYYQIRSRVNEAAWGAWTTWSTTVRTKDEPVSQGERYGFQSQARCGTTGDLSPISNSAYYTHPINAPAKPALTAALTSVNGTAVVRATIAVVTCPSGASPLYRTAYRYNANALSAYNALSATRVRDLTAYYGALHTFRGQVVCKSAYIQSPATTTSDANYIRQFVVPSVTNPTLSCDGSSGNDCKWGNPTKYSHPGPTSGASYEYASRQCRQRLNSNSTYTGWSSDWSKPSSGVGSSSNCYYFHCNSQVPNSYQSDRYQVRWTIARMKSPYITGPSATPTTNSDSRTNGTCYYP